MMIHREYIEPLLEVVYIKSQPILAGSADDYIPEGSGEAKEWGAKGTSMDLWADDEEE